MANFRRRMPLGIIPHDAFLRMATTATLDHYQHHPHLRVAGKTAFEEMQAYLTRVHSGMDVVHSFEDAAGQVFDCVPIEQQLGLRGGSEGPKKPPDLRAVAQGGAAQPSEPAAAWPMEAATRDRHGNPQQAPAGTIPVRRVTLEEMLRFRDLRSFLRKHPSAAAAATLPVSRPSLPDPNSSLNHRYAVGQQQISNIGGHSYISVYAPTVTSDETFSLAQQWYSAGSGSNVQTVEVGWQVFPQKYGHANPVLFIFWTADGYQTGGVYNLDGPGFVQVNSNITIGGARSPVSAAGGTQNEMEIAVYFADSAWWIYIDGLASGNALGYYPADLFGTGSMSTGAADTIEFGGETVSGNPPSGNWGPMGSGAMGSSGWLQAAYQRYIFYYPPASSAQWATLNQIAPSSCYSFNGSFDGTGSWGTYFFFGGPGGGNC